MKLSKLLLALTLIASVLLLSAARSVIAHGLGPSQSLPQQGNNATQQAQTDSEQRAFPTRIEQTPTSINSPSSQSGPEEIRKDCDQNAGTLWKIWEWITNISAQASFTFVTTVATVLLAIFTGLLVSVTRDLHRATLHVDRPFLLVTGVSCTNVVRDGRGDSAWHHYTFTITMRNFGVGPADVIGYGIWAVPFDRPTTAEDEPDIQYLPKVQGEPLADSLVASGELAKDRISQIGTLSDTQYQSAKMGEKWIGIHGFIRYRGASPKVYRSCFFWWCPLDRSGDPIAPVRALRKDLNDHT
jgi:hypothetical protein